MIAIIDYGVGNLGSISNMLKKAKADCYVANTAADIKRADKIILPGVGHFETAINTFKKSGLVDVIEDRVFNDRIPILGICVGMQMLANYSEEGNVEGLGWIPGTVRHFKNKVDVKKFRIPHMGWNYVQPMAEHEILNDFEEDAKFYFVHSYYFDPKDHNHILMQTNYDGNFTSMVQKDNIIGAQFHPEKSHKYGMQLMKNFANIGE